MAGIKESKELVVGAFAIAALLIKQLKDGLQLQQDVSAIVSAILLDPALRAKLEAAASGLQSVGSEVSDISLGEGFELVGLVVAEAQKLVVGVGA